MFQQVTVDVASILTGGLLDLVRCFGGPVKSTDEFSSEHDGGFGWLESIFHGG